MFTPAGIPEPAMIGLGEIILPIMPSCFIHDAAVAGTRWQTNLGPFASPRDAIRRRPLNQFERDMTPTVNLTQSRGTGPVRHQRPVYVDLLPPCNAACPAGENIQAWLDLAQAGKFQAAWEALIRDNPLPSVHGRVCYHPCETGCNRQALDSAVGIHAVERFLGDMAIERNWPMPAAKAASGKRVLVVGAGPSGLSAAYHLARLGHQVEIHDAGPLAGRYAAFRDPRLSIAARRFDA